LRRGRVLVVVGHRERKALIVRVGYGMARRGRRKLLGGPVCWSVLVSVLERVRARRSEVVSKSE
jgi:hypothetical protein